MIPVIAGIIVCIPLILYTLVPIIHECGLEKRRKKEEAELRVWENELNWNYRRIVREQEQRLADYLARK